MNKKYLIITSCLLLVGLFAGIWQYIETIKLDYASAVTVGVPNPGHAWSSMECSASSLCIDTSANYLGIGTSTPSAKLDVAGSIRSTSSTYINNTSPTIFLQDTDHRSGVIHQNSNLMYFLSGSGVNGASWTINGSYWPLTLNMTDDSATFGGPAYFMEGNVGVGTTTPAQKLEVSGNILASGDVCNAAGACLSQINSYVSSQPLLGAVHTRANCTSAGGTVVDIGQAYPLCRFNQGSCPSGWTGYNKWSTTSPATGTLIYNCDFDSSYNTGSHSWSDHDVECTCSFVECSGSCGGQACSSMIQRGCY